jgi:hypothetical protein
LNCDQNTLDIAEDVVVPEPQHFEAVVSQATVANRVCGGFIVLSAVDFDDEGFLRHTKSQM